MGPQLTAGALGHLLVIILKCIAKYRSVRRRGSPAFILLMAAAQPILTACASRSLDSQPAVSPEAQGSSAVIEFRLAHLEPGEGRIAIEMNDSVFYLAPKLIVSDDDFVAVRPTIDEGGLILWIEMTPEGAARLTEVTANNIGSRMGLVFNSELVSALVIRSGGVSPPIARVPIENAEHGAQLVRNRWPSH